MRGDKRAEHARNCGRAVLRAELQDRDLRRTEWGFSNEENKTHLVAVNQGHPVIPSVLPINVSEGVRERLGGTMNSVGIVAVDCDVAANAPQLVCEGVRDGFNECARDPADSVVI